MTTPKNATSLEPTRPLSLGRSEPVDRLFDPQLVEMRARHPERRTDWMITVSGKRVFLLDTDPATIDLGDIAHALSMQCRFAGHTTKFYSVCEHSVHVSKIVPPEHALAGLLHDASEAYVGDLIRPLKRLLPDYERVEGIVWKAIATRHRLPEVLPPEIKWADNVMLLAERRQVITHSGHDWHEDSLGLASTAAAMGALPCWSPEEARLVFLARFDEITNTKKDGE